MATGAHTWSCPACGRRVPLRVSACHCGMTRERAEAQAEAQAQARTQAAQATRRPARPSFGPRTPRGPLPRDVKVMLSGVVLVALGAVGWLAFGPRPDPIVPVLGYVDAAPPPPPKPTPPPTPPFRLPWWK